METGKTPSEMAILMYLRLRQMEAPEGFQAATKADILRDLQLSERTVDGALRKLKSDNLIEKKEIYLPRPWQQKTA